LETWVHIRQAGNVWMKQENDTRSGNIRSGKHWPLAFTRCAAQLDPCRPGAVDGELPFITHVLLVTIAVAMTLRLGHAQVLVTSQPTMSPTSTTIYDKSGDNQSASISEPSDQMETSQCRLQVQDTFPQPLGNVTEATLRIGTSDYSPLSARCKFNLFLKQTYSPYTFVSAGFQATWAQAMGQWPHYGGGMEGWGKRFGATLTDTESRRFIQTFALSTILHQDPRYFPSRKRALIGRVWYSTTRVVITRNDNGNTVFNTSEFLGLCSAVHYKMPTTQEMTELSGTP
jgi:hypothetical protein